MEWRFSPFSVANKSYEVQSRLCFESQLVHAVIEQRAPIVGRLRHKFEGEGDDRRCIVTAVLRETNETLEYISPPFSKIQPKNSPLWKTKPDLQLYYNTSRDFCRAYFPDVLLGVYSQDELRDHVGPDNARDVNERPSVAQRLKAKGARGFNASHVERETRGGVVDESTTTKGDAGHSETQPDLKPYDQDLKNTESGATDAHRQPDRAETLADTSTGGDNASQAGNSGQAGEMPATDSNSVESSPQPDAPAAAEDAPLIPAAAAGDASQPSAPSPADEEAQASEASPTGLPSGWEITYSAALRRAQKKESLSKYGADYWKQYGGWSQHKDGPNGATAVAIFDAYSNNFGNREQIEAALREII